MSEHLTNIVVCGLIHRDGKIFIAKRATTKTFHPDMFEIIGGHLEPGETLEAGLIREIKEEIDVDVKVGTLVDAFSYESDGKLKVELCYLCELTDEDAEPALNPKDHSTAMWISMDEIDKFEKDDEETAALRKAFNLLEMQEDLK